ncbi:MAG: HTH-type transcriptional regulator IscR [Phycisphaerae bacterium]|nr:HTH-type transcriptional regulator IscR [Phycisphaerae bacterium]
MEITRTTDYAVRVVLDLAIRLPSGQRVTSGQIARRQGIPPGYVPKVMQSLSRAGILATLPGRTGGVQLLRDPKELTVLEVVEAMEGPVALNRCLIRKGECPRDVICTVHKVWARAQESLTNVLAGATIASLIPPDERIESRAGEPASS